LPRTAPPDEQILTRLSAGGTNVVINRLPGLLGHLESNWLAGLLLPDRRPVQRVPTGGNILDPKGNDVTSAQFAVNREIE
jgi:hypothetical protein